MNSNFLYRLKSPGSIYCSLAYRIVNLFAKYMSDETYLRLRWHISFGENLNLKSPRTFNEKLQWLKLNDRNPLYSKLVDKYEVKDYVASIIGKDYIIPTLGVYEKAEDIDFDSLPRQFVLKVTHDSGGIVICKDKSKLNKQKIIKKLNNALHSNFYIYSREWPYKNVKPRIIAEEYISELDGDLRDYKFFCFNGIPIIMFVASDRFIEGQETKFDFFDMEFNHLKVKNGHPNSSNDITKPKGFEQMIKMAGELSKGFPHARIDFYDINGKIYFGEITFYHFSGFVRFEPQEWDFKLGEYLKLPHERFK